MPIKNNHVAFRVDYRIPIDEQEIKPKYSCSVTPQGKHDEKDMVLCITCIGH